MSLRDLRGEVEHQFVRGHRLVLNICKIDISIRHYRDRD